MKDIELAEKITALAELFDSFNRKELAGGFPAPGSSSLFSSLDDMILWAQYLDRCVFEREKIFSRMLAPTVLNNG